MKKLTALAAGALMLLAGSASAASITNVEFSNGDVTIQGNAGQSVSGKVRVVVPVNEEVEFMQFDIVSDSLAPVCESVGRLQEGTHFVNIPSGVKFPPNTGEYSLEVDTAGRFGGQAAIDCVNDNNGSASFGSSVRTVGGNSSSSTVGGTSQMDALMAAINALILKLTQPTTPTKPAHCASMPMVNSWSGSAQVETLQSWMVAHGYMTASAMATGPGVYGLKTTAAHFAAQNACK